MGYTRNFSMFFFILYQRVTDILRRSLKATSMGQYIMHLNNYLPTLPTQTRKYSRCECKSYKAERKQTGL